MFNATVFPIELSAAHKKEVSLSLLTKVTPDNPATLIAWVSTCLLAGGAGTLLSENASVVWMTFGSFGLAAAVGLDIAARVRQWRVSDDLTLLAIKRLDCDIDYKHEDKAAKTAIREAVARMLGLSALKVTGSRRTNVRFPCDLEVELIVSQGLTRIARITNLSESGFELMLTEPLQGQRVPMIVVTAKGGQETMFGEVLWYGPQVAGSIVAGGRFLDAAPVDDK